MKQPAMQFEVGDWLRDPALSMCSPATRGIWLDLLCVCHELGRSGQVTGTPEQLARSCRCTAAEFVAAIAELRLTRAADINEREGSVTVINRRMQREHRERVATARRVQRHRCNGSVTGDVTPLKRDCNNEPSDGGDIYINNTLGSNSLGEEKSVSVEERSSSTAQKSPPKQKPPTDPRKNHPAIQAFRSLTSRYPNKELWDSLIAVLGENPDLLKLRDCRVEWIERGYNPQSLKWATDWYATGIPPRPGANGNGNGRNPKPTDQDSAASDVSRFKAGHSI